MQQVKEIVKATRRALCDDQSQFFAQAQRLISGIIDDTPLDQMNYLGELFGCDEMSSPIC